MKETHPGVYEADYKAPNNVNVTGAAVVGELTAHDGSASPTVPAPQPLTIDNAAPTAMVLNPPPSAMIATAAPHLYALLSDGLGVGIDTHSIRVLLDGQDVTGKAVLTKTSAAYAPASPLTPGPHAARLIVADYLGNTSEKNWSFTVAAPSNAMTFQSDRVGPQVDLSAGQSLGLTLRAPPGGAATYALGNAPRVLLVETSPGVYTALFKASAGRSVTDAPVVADYKPRGGSDVFLELPQTVSVQADPPRTPFIFSPPDGVDIGKILTVAGRSAPNTVINVLVTYVSKTLGLFTVTGTAAQQQVTTNAKGQWRTVEMNLALPSLISKTQNTTLTISAVAVDATGQSSDPAISKVMQE